MADHLFPTLTENDYTADGQPIYGGSIGLNKFYDYLVQTAGSSKATPFRVIVINALTLIRNNYDRSYKECARQCRHDIQTLMTYMSVYLKKMKKKDDRKLTIIIMYPNYNALPEPLRRPYSAEMQRLVDVYQKEIKDVPKDLHLAYNDDVLSIFSVQCGTRRDYPHQELRDLLRDQMSKEKSGKHQFTFRLDDPIHLITHVPMDWHLSAYYKNVNLIESYTGKILPSKDFGGKLIGIKDKVIPFDSVIHQVFGDKVLVKPLATRNNKKLLLDSALKWSMMPVSGILKVITETLSVSRSELTKYKFV